MNNVNAVLFGDKLLESLDSKKQNVKNTML